jgi:putative methionine-R-sulfoxide reductase with GAF domain
VVEVNSRRYAELERLAKTSGMVQRTRLSTNVKVERGAAPAAGYEESADKTASDLMKIRASIEAAAAQPAAPEEGSRRSDVSASRPQVFAELRETLVHEVPYEFLAVYLRRDNRLVPEYMDGESQARFAALEIPMGRGLAGWVAEYGTAIINGDPSVEPGFVNEPALGSALAVPLESPDGVAGVLSLYRRERNAFRTQELRVLFSVATRVRRRLELLPQVQ